MSSRRGGRSCEINEKWLLGLRWASWRTAKVSAIGRVARCLTNLATTTGETAELVKTASSVSFGLRALPIQIPDVLDQSRPEHVPRGAGEVLPPEVGGRIELRGRGCYEAPAHVARRDACSDRGERA